MGALAYSIAVQTSTQCKNDILSSIAQLHRARINNRLQTKKSRYLVQDGLEKIVLGLKEHSESLQHSLLVNRLETLCKALRQYCDQLERYRTMENVKRVVRACHDFFNVLPTGESMKNALACGGVETDESHGNPHLRQIGKIASLFHIAEILSMIASHQDFHRLCVNLSIQYLPAYKIIQSPIPAADGGSRDCRVHAEVQLVVDFDSRDISGWYSPRVIGSSKAPCFLCELFVNQHGKYFVPRTHGRLTPRWTIPDLKSFGPNLANQYRSIIKLMDREIQNPVDISELGRLDPAMSWQALSQLNVAELPSLMANDINSVLPNVREGSPCSKAAQNFDKEQPLATSELSKVPLTTVDNKSERLLSQPSPRGTGSVTKKLAVGSDEPHVGPGGKFDDHATLSNTLPTRKVISSNLPYLPSCKEAQHLPKQGKQEQARSSMDLGFEQSTQTARVIRDHESRACDILFEYGIKTGGPRGQPTMPYSNNMNRRIDFHDTELFLEVEHSTTMQVLIIPCLRPKNQVSQLVIEVNKLQPGEALQVDTGEISGEYRVMFLTKTDKKGSDQWWVCIWKNSSWKAGTWQEN